MKMKEFKIGENVVIPRDIRVSSVNVKTSLGRKARKEQILKADKLVKVIKVGVSTSFVYHGDKYVVVEDEKYTYTLLESQLRGSINVLGYDFTICEGKCIIKKTSIDEIVMIFDTNLSANEPAFESMCEEKAELLIKGEYAV